MFPVPTAPHALHLPTPQSGTSPYQRVGANHSPLGWGRVPGELMLPASPGWSLGACLPPAAPPGGPSALRGEDRGEPPQLTPAHPRSLTLTLGGLGKPRFPGALRDARLRNHVLVVGFSHLVLLHYSPHLSTHLGPAPASPALTPQQPQGWKEASTLPSSQSM